MSDKLDVYACDDYPSQLTLLEEAVIKVSSPSVDIKEPDINIIKCLMDSQDSWKKAAQIFSTITGDFAIFLDLGFHDNTPVWPCVIERLKSELVNDDAGCNVDEKGNLYFPHEALMRDLPGKAVDGIALALAALRNPNPGRTLIYVITGRGAAIGHLSQLLALLVKYYSKINSKRRCSMVRDIDGRKPVTADFAEDIVIAFKEKWIRTFPNFHSDPLINNCITKWLDFYRRLSLENVQDKFCKHGIDNSEKWTIEGSPDDYSKLIGEMFEVPEKLPEDTNGIKALIMLDKKPSANISAEDWFREWDIQNAEPIGNKKITKELLSLVLSTVFNDINININPAEIRLPIIPVLPFILALRVLLGALRGQEGGSIVDETGTVSLVGTLSDQGTNGAYRLSIPLKLDGPSFGLAKEWVRKRVAGGCQLNDDGVCAAIWRASLAKLEISVLAAQSDIEKALLGLFEGPGRPVAGVSYAPRFIHLHWS